MAIRTADAEWQGNLRQGDGHMKFGGGAFDGRYSFASRFEEGTGTNPEELIAAAHAGCFNMATAFQLSGAGHPPESLHTEATLTMEQDGGGWKIASVHLTMRAKVPGLDEAKFLELAQGAKANCPVSRVLKANITLDAKLAS